MMTETVPESTQIPPALPPGASAGTKTANPKSKIWIVVLIAVLILGGIVAGTIYLLQPGSPTDKIRDVFIIFMALEFLVVGVALVILMIQLAILINLLQNEVKPILNSTNETVNTLRGTVTFLSDNLAEPVIKLNQTMAGFKKLLDLLRPGGK
jgi:hypothetical protein